MANLLSTSITNSSNQVLIRSTGSLIKVDTLVHTPQVSISPAQAGTLFSVTYNKVLGSSASSLIIKLDSRGCGPYSGVCGTYLSVAGTRNYSYSYLYSNGSEMTMLHGIAVWDGVAAGNNTITVGWDTADGGGGNAPFSFLNPNAGQTDSRFRDQDSTITVWEYTI
jgi:hypothetical protein